jgi:acyl-coenzyme A thioesterase PaaI-like protein
MAGYPKVVPAPRMQRTVDALRRAIKAMYHVMPDVDAEDMATHAESLADAIERESTIRLRQPDDVRHSRSPMTGIMNPVSPPMTTEYFPETQSVTCHIRYNEAYQGPPNCVHGGFVAAILDEGLGATRHLTDKRCVTGQLNVTYKRPTPINADLVLHARIVEMHERKMLVTGEITHKGEITASAEGLFVFLDPEKFNALAIGAREASR